MREPVAFIGVGQMGGPMAARLAGAGFAVFAVDADAAALARIAAVRGVQTRPSPLAAAREAAVVFTCLPSEESLRRVYFGEDGIATAARAGLVTVDCSTITPDLAVEVGRRMGALGVKHVDAPVFGTTGHAARGDAFFCVSGELGALPLVEPCLRAMGRAVRVAGAAGNASRIKLLQNALGYVAAVATAEVLAVARLSGLELADFIAVVRECDGIGNSAYFDHFAEHVAEGKDGGGGRLAIAAKDIELANRMAASLGAELPLLGETARAYAEAKAAGLSGHEYTEVARIIERRIGRALFYRP
jgi:3-hydroxyisobutyrate dehydrogenase-like beta-hydroxyacid dehydrogenase